MMNSAPTRGWRAKRVAGAAIGVAVISSGLAVSASPAVAAPDPWESQSGIYHYFTVPKSSVPSGTCGNSTGAGAELEGNIGPSGTWAAVGLDASGNNCVANIGPMEPGLYYYQYVATMADRSKQAFRNPDSPVEVTSHPNWNTLFVPGPEVAWMDDVPAGGGAVSEVRYDSAAGGEGSIAVWTPAGYDADRTEPYPVLYLLADEGQSYREWLELGRAKQVLDNLVQDGDAKPMVVVMADANAADPRAELLDRIVPAARASSNISSRPQDQAIAGVGTGAEQALDVLRSDPGSFAYVGSFSGSVDGTITKEQAKAINKGTELLRVYVGNTLDPSHNANYDLLTDLKAAGVKFEFDGVNPDDGGTWDAWRENLRDFATRAFQKKVADHGMSDGHRALTKPYAPPATGSITTPHIDADGMVTFETGTQWADAKDVVLWGDWAPNGQWFRIPLTKVGDRWRTTIGPIDGYYYWRYEVDGVGVHDPADTKNTENIESQLYVPGGVRTPLLADVPADRAGEVKDWSYTNAYDGKQTKVRVWTPRDYDPERSDEYPVLYLYHGFGQNWASWSEVGRATQILDNLYARGDIVPMVVVMPGYPGAPSDLWNDLSNNVMPLVSSHYNVSTEPSKRALAGLSWGGLLTHNTLVNHPGAFSYFGIFSPPFTFSSIDGTTPAGQTAIASTKLVSLFVGDVDTGAVNAVNGIQANLTSNAVPTVKTVVPGPHGFDVWWQGLSDFLPRIFQPEAPAWDATKVYDDGDRVSYGGATFVAQWWTKNEKPGSTAKGSWMEQGALVPAAGGGVRAWTSSWVYTGGETVAYEGHTWKAKWWTRNQAPGDVRGPWQDLGAF